MSVSAYFLIGFMMFGSILWLEGIAGKAWGANSKTYEILDLPNLSEVEKPQDDPLVAEYGRRSYVSRGPPGSGA